MSSPDYCSAGAWRVNTRIVKNHHAKFVSISVQYQSDNVVQQFTKWIHYQAWKNNHASEFMHITMSPDEFIGIQVQVPVCDPLLWHCCNDEHIRLYATSKADTTCVVHVVHHPDVRVNNIEITFSKSCIVSILPQTLYAMPLTIREIFGCEFKPGFSSTTFLQGNNTNPDIPINSAETSATPEPQDNFAADKYYASCMDYPVDDTWRKYDPFDLNNENWL